VFVRVGRWVCRSGWRERFVLIIPNVDIKCGKKNSLRHFVLEVDDMSARAVFWHFFKYPIGR